MFYITNHKGKQQINFLSQFWKCLGNISLRFPNQKNIQNNSQIIYINQVNFLIRITVFLHKKHDIIPKNM